MTPEFASIVNPVFQSVLKTLEQIESGRTLDLHEVKSRLNDVFHQADMRAKRAMSGDVWLLAKRGLCYWTDEVLTKADRRWEDQIFELDFFDERNRARNFYYFGEEARQKNHDLAELWYLCVVLGFDKGNIEAAFRKLDRPLPGDTSDSEEARKAWVKQLRNRVSMSAPEALEGPPLDHVGWTRDDGSSALQTAAWFLGVMAVVAICLVIANLKNGSLLN